tara:strand:- start:453 stop:728 length:276 start_codon:yes stop_codon:yes gene_type:complete
MLVPLAVAVEVVIMRELVDPEDLEEVEALELAANQEVVEYQVKEILVDLLVHTAQMPLLEAAVVPEDLVKMLQVHQQVVEVTVVRVQMLHQ